MKRLSALLTALWLGMQIGFYAASLVLFNQLDKADAGRVAGILFHIANWTGLLAWSLTLLVCHHHSAWDAPFFGRRRPPRKAIGILLGLLAVSEFLFHPVIAALKTGGGHWLVQWFGGSFGTWHGISYMVHLCMSLLGLALCVRLLRLNTD